MATLTAEEAFIDFTGSELVIKFEWDQIGDMPDHVGIAFSEGCRSW